MPQAVIVLNGINTSQGRSGYPLCKEPGIPLDKDLSDQHISYDFQSTECVSYGAQGILDRKAPARDIKRARAKFVQWSGECGETAGEKCLYGQCLARFISEQS